MATQNNEDTFPVDRPEASDTESDQEGKILETHAITTTVHEMKVKGFHLVEKKQETLVDPKASDSIPKMTRFFKNQSSFRKHQADHYKGNIILLFSIEIVKTNICEYSSLVVQIKYGKKTIPPTFIAFSIWYVHHTKYKYQVNFLFRY